MHSKWPVCVPHLQLAIWSQQSLPASHRYEQWDISSWIKLPEGRSTKHIWQGGHKKKWMSSCMLHSLVTTTEAQDRENIFSFPSNSQLLPHSHPNMKVCDLQDHRLGIWFSWLSYFSLGPHPKFSRPRRVRQKLSSFSEEPPDAAGSNAVGSPGQSPGFHTSMRSGSSNQISRILV